MHEQTRIIINWDMSSLEDGLFMNRLETSPEVMQRLIEETVDEEVAVGMDMLIHCIFIRFYSHLKQSAVTTLPKHRYSPQQVLAETGLDVIQVMLDRCHAHNVRFLGGLRMNSSHGDPTDFGQWFQDHPQWHQKGAVKIDYTYDEVRQAMLTFVAEWLDAYAVDGMEFDWMRFMPAVPEGDGPTKAHLLTDFTCKARELLDKASKQRGVGRLVLGVRVPETLPECEHLGFDLEAWIKEGCVDYVVPSDFNHINYNAKVEEFVKLTEGTQCEIYPPLHPSPCDGDVAKELMPANYRAAAQNYHAFGAHGLYAFNWMYHWDTRRQASRYTGPGCFWPGALGYLHGLRDPEMVSRADRHYLFVPRWEKGHEPVSPLFPKDDSIELERNQAAPSGGQRFRVAEDFTSGELRGTLQFKAVGLAEEEHLEICINDAEVAAEHITRVVASKGQNKWQGRVLPPFDLYFIDLNWRAGVPLVHGDNQLFVRLLGPAAAVQGLVRIEELEVYVYVRPG